VGLSRLRAHGDLGEIRDLAFSVDESAALLHRALDVDLRSDDIRTIHERTEGWAAGLHLAALTARGQSDPVAFLLDGTPENPMIADLLCDEVLARQPPDVRRFLVDTSILERLCASLCAAVSGRYDAEALLRELERGNVFLISVDAGGRWHRFHQLFGEALACHRRQLPADELGDLHRRASEWYAGHDRPAEAIEHALLAGDVRVAPDEDLPGSPYTPEAAATIIRAMLALSRGNLPEALANARRAHAMEADVGRTVIGHWLGVILFYAHDSAAAEPLLWGCLTGDRTADRHAQAVSALGYLAAGALDHGDAVRARRLGRDALDTARAHDLDEYALTSVAEGALGAARSADGDRAEAEKHLERAVALARRCGQSYEIALAQLQLAAGRLRERDRKGGQ